MTSKPQISYQCARRRSYKYLATALLLAGGGPSHAYGAVTYYYTSPQGTVLAIADSTGTILERDDYRPYGARALGSSKDGPGYGGHVNDADVGLSYMQARYYDPESQTFLSVDPMRCLPGDLMSFNRYAYGDLNPLTRIDPDGREAQLFWSAPNRVDLTVNYIIGHADGAHLNMTPAQINEAVQQRFSGSVSLNGSSVTISAHAVNVSGTKSSGVTTFVKVVPDTRGITRTGRAETNKVGGNYVTIASSGPYAATPDSIGHELGGHVSGAGDQYATGIDVNGNELQQDAPGASGVMYDGRGGANNQSLREVLQSPSNTNTCAPGVKAANGGC